ncbi:hypothetical protein O0I10_008311 [Lichtheimia ornata]|uniref:Alpha/beta hydrolase fold-3 domain-containing protein n=1 Tax=Lichtheimia ornata TaxID=688661 RepID=A0AAD7UYN5_9FUNG|nr:uncharacterized protein O0I10_008311 [Lichtheimia ornata]KAJ8656088.1 hypothetical protein O0I10_008311 [Lichtheimia ornata]
MLESLIRHGLSGVVALACIFILTKSGRKFAAHVFFGGIRKMMLLLPHKTRCNFIKKTFALPLDEARRRFEKDTQPYGYQWDAIVKVDKPDGVQGHWITPNVHKQGGLQWVEKTANDVDLVIMHVHGGGFMSGHSLMYTPSFLYMLERFEKVHGIRTRIFSAEYRYFPEVSWPVFREDCEKAYGYLMHELQIHPSKVVIGGDSAGGHVVATMLLSILDQQQQALKGITGNASLLPMPKGAFMVSPWVRFDTFSPTFTTNLDKDCLPFKPNDLNGWMIADFYNKSRDEQDALLRNPYASPLYGNYNGACPMLITLGGREVLLHDIEDYIGRLKTQGIKLDVIKHEDGVHLWAIERFLAQDDRMWHEGVDKIIDWCASTVCQ